MGAILCFMSRLNNNGGLSDTGFQSGGAGVPDADICIDVGKTPYSRKRRVELYPDCGAYDPRRRVGLFRDHGWVFCQFGWG